MNEKKAKYAPSESKCLITTHKRTIIRNPNLPLTAKQIQILLNGIDILEDKTLIQIGLDIGPRVSEVSISESKEKGKKLARTPGILISNIEFDAGIIRIWDEKKNCNRNTMPSKATMALIRMYLNERKINDPRLFRFSAKTAERKIQYWTKRLLGITRSWHSLRVTYVSRCAEVGQNIIIAQENTGDSIRTLLKYYTKLSPETRRRMTEELPVIPVTDDEKMEM